LSDWRRGNRPGYLDRFLRSRLDRFFRFDGFIQFDGLSWRICRQCRRDGFGGLV
jgi:hypothetical protein